MCRAKKAVIFGGTTEGRILAEFCHERGISALVCVTSEYGRQLLPASPWLNVHDSPLDLGQMETLLREEGIALVLDATHPYALQATENIRQACQAAGRDYVRILRGREAREEDLADGLVWADSADEAADYLALREGKVFVATGSKELAAFARMPGYQDRIYARVLPDPQVLSACQDLGIRGKHLLGVQGPFSREMNAAMLRHTGASYLVTKEGGAFGGFEEKLLAAADCHVKAVVIRRPGTEEGVSLEEAKNMLQAMAPARPDSHGGNRLRKVELIGIGMGSLKQLTFEAAEALEQCDAVLGGARMLESMAGLLGNKKKEGLYLGEDLLAWLEAHPQFGRVGVLYSGDTGFYSGAKQLAGLLGQEPWKARYQVRAYPGISSLSCLCARLGMGYEDVQVVSLHGKDWDIAQELSSHPRVFALLGGGHDVKYLCSRLLEAGLGDAVLHVGERLSYPEERITTGKAKELGQSQFHPLAAVLIEGPGKCQVEGPGKCQVEGPGRRMP